MAIKLLITALYNAILAILLYLLDKRTIFNKLGYKTKQTIYGILFGIMAIYMRSILTKLMWCIIEVIKVADIGKI